MEDWKRELFQRALMSGIAKDPQWIERLDEPVPMWVLLEMLLRLNDSIDHPDKPYD